MIDFKKPILSTKLLKYTRDYNSKNKIFNMFAHKHVGMFVDVNFVKICSDGSIGYLPSDKYEKCKNHIENGDISGFEEGFGRIKCKPGKFINKYINPELLKTYNIQPRDIEQFCLILKSSNDFYYSQIKLSMVDGEDIRKYYDQDYYADTMVQKGTLWKSCMRYKKTLPLLELYVRNPDKVKMMVGLRDNRVVFRALIWKTNEGHGLLDRLYYTRDSDVEFIRKWASENGLYQRYHHSAKDEDLILLPDGKVEKMHLTVNLDNIISIFPFLDTFKFVNMRFKTFSNMIDKPVKTDFVACRANGSVRSVEEYLNPNPVYEEEDDNYDEDDEFNF